MQLNVAKAFPIVADRRLDGPIELTLHGNPPRWGFTFSGQLIEPYTVRFDTDNTKTVGPLLYEDFGIWQSRWDKNPTMCCKLYTTSADDLRKDMLQFLFPTTMDFDQGTRVEAPQAKNAQQRMLATPFIREGLHSAQILYSTYLNEQLKSPALPDVREQLDYLDRDYATGLLSLSLAEGDCASAVPDADSFLTGSNGTVTGYAIRSQIASAKPLDPTLVESPAFQIHEPYMLDPDNFSDAEKKYHCKAHARSLDEGLAWIAGYEATH